MGLVTKTILTGHLLLAALAGHGVEYAALQPPALYFEENAGQFPADVHFAASGPGYRLLLGPAGASYRLSDGSELSLVLTGANETSAVEPSHPQPGTINYFVGDGATQRLTGIRTWRRVRLAQVYPAIDLVYRANGPRAEYDFELAAGADPQRISMRFEGADAVDLLPTGSLQLHTASGTLALSPPIAYQPIDGKHVAVEAAFRVRGDEVGFELGPYDPAEPLTIDPIVLGYATTLGGSGNDNVEGLAVGADGSIYVAGTTNSADFEGGSGQLAGGDDVYVARLSADGSQLLYKTFLGGSMTETARALTVDAAGNAYVQARTSSTDFVTTASAFQASNAGGEDQLIAKLDSSGAIAYSTYYGGALEDGSGDDGGIVVAPTGTVYITTRTQGLPAAKLTNAYETTCTVQCVLVAGFDMTLSGPASLVYGSTVDGSGDDGGQDIGVDGAGNLYIFGFTSSDADLVDGAQAFQPTTNDMANNDNFIIKLNPALSGAAQRVFSSYIGSPGDEVEPRGALFVDSESAVYVLGATSGLADSTAPYGAGFPVKNALQSVPGAGEYNYLMKIDSTQTGDAALVFSTFTGPAIFPQPGDVVVDSRGTVSLTSRFYSSLLQPVPAYDAFAADGASLVRIDGSGQTALLASPLPATISRLALGPNDRLYVAGRTSTPFFELNPLAGGPTGGNEVFLAAFDTLPVTGATLTVEATTGAPGVNEDFAYLINLTNNSVSTQFTGFSLTGDFPSGNSTSEVGSPFCFTSGATLTCDASAGTFAGASAIGPNETITLMQPARFTAAGPRNVSALTVSSIPADSDTSDNSDGTAVTVVTNPPGFSALSLADFAARNVAELSGGFAMNTPRGILASANGVLNEALSFQTVANGAFPVYVVELYSAGQLAIGFTNNSWTPTDGDFQSLFDNASNGHTSFDRVYALIRKLGRGPVAEVELRSANAFNASMLVSGPARVALDPNKAFALTVDTVQQLATVSYDGQVVLSENPFLGGGANAADIGNRFSVSVGRGVENLGAAIFNDTPVDRDGDGLSDTLEASLCSDPGDSDSDDDGLSDGAEDANGNGSVDAGETDPCNPDSDGDGLKDGTELGVTAPLPDPDGAGPLLGTNPGSFMADADPTTTTDPTDDDSDNDGARDGDEDTNGNGRLDAGESDPNDSNSVPAVPVQIPAVNTAALLIAMLLLLALAYRSVHRRRPFRTTG